jgi:curved DNA-binding protein CbpA
VTENHYLTLGILPGSDQARIKAAYHSLMRRYHPDANGSAEAAERAREINAAYWVLSDPQRRQAYDARRVAPPPSARWVPAAPPRTRFDFQPEMRRRSLAGPVMAGTLSLIAAGLLAAALIEPSALTRALRTGGAGPVPTNPPARAVQAAAEAPAPQRRAEEPSIDPAAAPFRGTVEPAPTGRIEPLAVALPKPARERIQTEAAPEQRDAEPKSAAAPELALLESQANTFFRQSWQSADASRRALLLRSRDMFEAQRRGCRSESCLSDLYLQRLQNMTEIMQAVPDSP